MKALIFRLTCPRCGGELLEGEPGLHSPDRVQYLTRCDHCLDLYRIEATATMVEAWPHDRLDPACCEARRRGEAAYALNPLEGING